MNRTVFAVDRNQFGAWRGAQWLHHRTSRNEALLVGQCQSLAGLQRVHRDRKAGEAHHGVHHHIGHLHQGGHVAHYLGEGQGLGHAGALRGVGNRHQHRAELERLFDEHIDRRPHAEADDLVVTFCAHHIECLRANAATAAGNGHAPPCHESSATS